MVYSLTWLPTVLGAAGLKVATTTGWMTRGAGNVGAIRGVMCHHTAGAGPSKGNMPSLNTLINGIPGKLSGPLCQLGLGRDGTFYVVAAGRANHAGSGDYKGEKNGNLNFIGIEAENMGTHKAGKLDDPWPAKQLDAYARGVAAILEHIGASSDWCCGHKEYRLPVRTKMDPLFDPNYRHAANRTTDDMDDFRAQVAAIMTGKVGAPVPIPPKDPKGRPTLQRGDRGAFVQQVQRKTGVTATGIYGPATEAAVRRLQRDNPPLVPDGIVGPKTWAVLDTLP